MSLLNVKFTLFPSLLSSPSASSSRVSASIPGRTRSWCQSADAPARWRESVRLVDSAPNTGYEPNLANSSSCTHQEHTAIDIPDRHQDFWSSDVVTMMSTSAEGIPNSEALSSSRKAAVSKVSSLLGQSCHPASGALIRNKMCRRNTVKEVLLTDKLDKLDLQHQGLYDDVVKATVIFDVRSGRSLVSALSARR